MKKVLKNILKWLVLVFICFSAIFTAIISFEQGGIIEVISYQVENMETPMIYRIESSNLENYIIYWQEMADNSLGNNDGYIYGSNEKYINRELELRELYKKYPVGVTTLIKDLATWQSMGALYIVSLIMGIVVGTAIYLMLDKEKKGLIIVIVVYLLSIIILGFMYGVVNTFGEGLTLLDMWMFPEEYIIPVTAIFALVILVRVIRQKDIAKKLNEKLNEIKEKSK